jgi:protein-tyrosine phosphatase
MALETLVGLDSNDLEAVSLFAWRERITDPTFDAESARQWMLGAYAGMPKLFAGFLASVFDRLSAPSSPVTLMHCTAGKDRTGFVCAMLLVALGVSRDDVFEDYLLSGKRRSPEELLQTLLGGELHRQPPKICAALLTMADVREDYLGTALRSIERDFGSVEAYLVQACRLGSTQWDRLRTQLLN